MQAKAANQKTSQQYLDKNATGNHKAQNNPTVT
jgi:hypothetical protein